MVQYC